MSKGSSSIPVGQETDFPAFKVVLVDASGQAKDRIGYRFHAPGAQATANGFNKQSADDRRGLTAEIQPFDNVVPGLDSEASQEEGPAKPVVSDNAAQLFDVVLCGAKNKKPMFRHVGNVSMAEAVKSSIDWSRDPGHTMPAVVVVAGSVQCIGDSQDDDDDDDNEAETDIDDDDQADSELEDSDSEAEADKRYTDGVGVFDGNDSYELGLMMDEAWLAAERGDYSQVVTSGMRYALCRYLLSVIQATIDNKIRSGYEIGMIAKGLERFCAQMIDTDDRSIVGFFDYDCRDFRIGYNGEISNDYGTVEALSAWLDARLDNVEASQEGVPA